MLSSTMADIVSMDLGNGSAVECPHEVLQELRRLAVDGFVAFSRGGLEIGGVLYGVREGTRLTIHGFAEFASEHARGPGFLLSEKDRPSFAQLLEPPPGLETLGWYRAHTRSGLPLDAGDRELFDQFPALGPVIGFVLKPAHWGPSAAAFYVREGRGEIVPQEPREFAIHPPERRPRELSQPAESQVLVPDHAIAITTIEAETPIEVSRQLALPRSFIPAKRWPVAVGVAVIFLAAAALAPRFRSGYAHDLGLEVYAVEPGQLRIAWNRNALPVLDGASGVIVIRDGEDNTRIPHDASQLRLSSICTPRRRGTCRWTCGSKAVSRARRLLRSPSNSWACPVRRSSAGSTVASAGGSRSSRRAPRAEGEPATGHRATAFCSTRTAQEPAGAHDLTASHSSAGHRRSAAADAGHAGPAVQNADRSATRRTVEAGTAVWTFDLDGKAGTSRNRRDRRGLE
ncbi:MAG: hypothetical protein WDO73_03945 [Ignavibacteriota bacterium]